MVKQNQTMAKMDKETLRRLKELRLTQRESYNEIIIRLLENLKQK